MLALGEQGSLAVPERAPRAPPHLDERLGRDGAGVRVGAAGAIAALAATCSAAAARTPGPVPVPSFRHVVVVVFENKERPAVLESRSAPTFSTLARRHAELTDYAAVTHPSLPNYLALVSGSTWGIRTNCTRCVVSGRSLADTVEAAGRSWKTYAEGYPSSPRYAKKHNPFVYFRRVVRSPARLRRIVPLAQLRRDLAAERLPDFSLVVPDLCHSMHDCSVAVGDAWLARIVPPLLTLEDTVVFVVFDEGTSAAGGGGIIPALALGTAVEPGTRVTRRVTHYGLLRTIEDAWGLPRLGRSRAARPIPGIWR
jgi:phosphatidylinositol-3-phosphatase